MLSKSALDLERKDAKKKRTSNPDPGFKSWEDNTSRQYMRLTRGIFKYSTTILFILTIFFRPQARYG